MSVSLTQTTGSGSVLGATAIGSATGATLAATGINLIHFIALGLGMITLALFFLSSKSKKQIN